MFNKLKHSTKDISFVFFVILLSLWLIFGITYSVKQSSQIEVDAIEQELVEITQSNINTIQYTFEEFFFDLRQRTGTIAAYQDYNPETASGLFTNMVRVQFAYLSITFLDGLVLTSEGTSMHLKDNTILFKLRNGEEFITDIYIDEVLNLPVIALYTPIINTQNQLEAYLCAVITIEEVTQIYDSILFTGGGYYHILDGKGEQIIDSRQETSDLFFNYFAQNPDISFALSSSLSEATNLPEQITVANNSTISYKIDDDTMYMNFMPLGINNWIVSTVIPRSAIEVKALKHRKNSLVMLINVSIILILVFIYIFTSRQKEYQAIYLMSESLRLLAKQTKQIIFEYDIATSFIQIHSDYGNFLPEKFSSHKINVDTFIRATVYKDDREKVTTAYKQLADEENTPDMNIRILHKNGTYLWVHVSHILIKDKKGNKKKVFIFLENIDEEIKKSSELLARAEQDSLTGLYNKITTEELIIDTLKDPRCFPAALFIIDLDNFKDINDTFGHLYGDDVLKEVSYKIRTSFRTNDIVGRIGGDEFFVFMNSFYNINQVQAKANDLNKLLTITYTKDSVDVTISASIGIALTHKINADFKQLYEVADNALYDVKNENKNGFKIISLDENIK